MFCSRLLTPKEECDCPKAQRFRAEWVALGPQPEQRPSTTAVVTVNPLRGETL